MAGSSRGATKRLMTELQTYQKDPNEELLDLGPADEDVMHWRAVMKGVEGTAYEGMSFGRSFFTCHYAGARLLN